MLEARARIGGRLATDRAWAGVPLEMGAAWIHGSKKNPVTELARSLSLKTEVTTWENERLYEDGEALSNTERDHVRKILERVLDAIERQSGGADRSLADAVAQAADDLELSKADRVALAYAVTSEIEHDDAADAADLSMRGVDEGKRDRGDDLVLPGGYDKILDALTPGVDVRLEHAVTKISYGDDGVVVETARGAFRAKQALVTLPVGVLKADRVSFDPPLPEAKRAALGVMGMDVLQKVYLRFDSVFWPEDVEVFGRIAADGEFVSLHNIAFHAHQPILMFFNAGTFARKVEKMTDEAVRALATKHLREMFGAETPEPSSCFVTRWGEDPWALGSYAHLQVGGKPSHRAALAGPIAGRVFFAGEATEKDYPATIHGALLSGRREAKRILEG
ncbi:MAG: FAD-dependent oxidoreductase [Polyangiaceae bacterium]